MKRMFKKESVPFMLAALAVRGHKVIVLERNEKALGASIRNFGMVWPIGQPDGDLYERALLSKAIWEEICKEAGIWYEEKGSLHLAYSALEQQVPGRICRGHQRAAYR